MIKIALTLLLAAFAGNALAANINIGPNGCTLADAIDSANMNVAIGNCAPGSGSDFIIAPDNWVITLNSPLPAIISNMTIRSATPAGLLYIKGDYNYRGLKITGNNTNVTLQRVHISEGKINVSNLQNPGAGIRIKNATVRLEDSLVVRNGTAQHPDSGIFMDGGDLTLVRSNVSSNAGTGIFAQDGSVHVVDSVISRNAFLGMSVYRSNLLVEGSLFDESWGGAGGAQTVAEFVNTTFTDTASGSYYPSQAFGFSGSSFVTLNHVTSRLYFRLDDSMLSASNSFLFTCVMQATNVLLDTGNLYHSTEITNPDNCLSDSPTDYSLLPLADNGGPTKTHAIYDLTSAAINGGDPAYCATVDQRGEARGDACEVGAYEVTGFADVAVTASIMPGAPYVSAQNIVVNAEIKNIGPSPATNVRFDLGANSAYVTNVSSPFCNAIPCVIARIQPGQTLVIPIEMKLGSYFSSPFSMAFSAHTTASSTYVDADENDPSGNNVYNLSHAINQGADLALTLDLLTSGPYFVGQTIDYQARIDNAGAQTATGVEFHFGGYKLGNVAFSGCTSVSGLLCKLPNISSGYSHTVGIQAKITDDQFDVVGSVSANQLDIDMGNNVDDRGNGGGVSDADISVVAGLTDSGPFHSLDYLEFKIFIRTGNQPASNIRISLDFPGSDFISLSSCPVVPCIIPQMSANSELALLARFFAPNFIPGVYETIDFHVMATPGQRDPVPSNNVATINEPLEPAVDVAVQLGLISTPPFYAGQEIQYALRVGNGGPNGANSIYVATIPENLTLRSAYGTLCQTMPCSISHLNEYDEENITLVYQIDSAGVFDLTAVASPNEFDHASGNNTDNSNNGGTAIEPANSDRIFADGFE